MSVYSLFFVLFGFSMLSIYVLLCKLKNKFIEHWKMDYNNYRKGQMPFLNTKIIFNTIVLKCIKYYKLL